MLTRAIELANHAHAGQVDKSGHPYIFHPVRVASTFSDEVLQTIAVLHDVVEDTDVTLADLDTLFPQGIVDAVDALTRRDGETYAGYILRVAQNPSARAVKIADIRDNLRPGAEHLRPRYEAALKVLEEASRNALDKERGG